MKPAPGATLVDVAMALEHPVQLAKIRRCCLDEGEPEAFEVFRAEVLRARETRAALEKVRPKRKRP